MSEARKQFASNVRRIANWGHTPPRIEHLLRRVAHRVQPLSLTCRICGARFVSTGDDFANAERAYDHWEADHA